MRMDREQGISAKEIVNTYPESELFRIIKEYGEERFAKNIARNIVKARSDKEIETTLELVDIIRRSMPAKARNGKGHPAKRTFQAIRIECNRELEVLRETLDDMVDLLSDRGRICIITFHSLEDRMVKSNFRKNENPCTCPPDFPVCVCGNISKGKVITRKPILPSEEEREGIIMIIHRRQFFRYLRLGNIHILAQCFQRAVVIPQLQIDKTKQHDRI